MAGRADLGGPYLIEIKFKTREQESESKSLNLDTPVAQLTDETAPFLDSCKVFLLPNLQPLPARHFE